MPGWSATEITISVAAAIRPSISFALAELLAHVAVHFRFVVALAPAGASTSLVI